MINQHLLFQIIQVAIGKRNRLERILTDNEWIEVLGFAQRQTVVGMVADAIESLPADQCPQKSVKLNCASMTLRIESRGIKTFRDSIEVLRRFENRGFRCCILKGQGNALAYNNPLRRQSGDIDLWIDGSRRDVIDFVTSKTKRIEARVHHVEYSEPGISTNIELHYIPMFLYSFVSQYRFKRYCRKEIDRQMKNVVIVNNGLVGIKYGDATYRMTVPTADFNAVFQMVHIMRHLFEEGIGLRQIIDYYYVLIQLPENKHKDVMIVLKDLGLGRFANSLMYVLKMVCGINEEKMLCPMDERNGKLLLDEILMAGNMGKGDERLDAWRQKSILHMFVWKLRNNLKYCRLCPSEVFWGPLFRIWHFCWRKVNGYVTLL